MKKLSELGISRTPWRIADGKARGRGIVVDGGWNYACSADGAAGSRQDANAILIAAAPGLYKCLREAVLKTCRPCPYFCELDLECKCADKTCQCHDWRAALWLAAGKQ